MTPTSQASQALAVKPSSDCPGLASGGKAGGTVGPRAGV
jgi:hypothetical protein